MKQMKPPRELKASKQSKTRLSCLVHAHGDLDQEGAGIGVIICVTQ